MENVVYLEHFSENQLFKLGIARIDGERFLLTVPTIDIWQEFYNCILCNCSLSQEWEQYWDGAEAQRVFCQDISGNSPQLMERHWNAGNDKDGENYIVPSSSMRFIRELLPMLIPLKTDDQFDDGSMDERNNGTISFGGSFYVNGQAKRVTGVPTEISDNRMVLGNNDVVFLSVGRSYDSEDSDFILPWMQINGVFVCMRCLITAVSFEGLCDYFQYSV